MCDALSWTSRGTWELTTEQQVRRIAGDQPRMIEERAITDVAMTILRRMSPGEANVTLYTQAQEGATGADFELLVFDPSGDALQFLVQAKAMRGSAALGEGYPALGQKAAGSTTTLQYERLLTACAPGGAKPDHAPLHVFYNARRDYTLAAWPDDRCGAGSGDEPARGIAVAHTADVVDAIEDGVRSYRVPRIAPVCWPWWCFLCCGGGGLTAIADRVVAMPSAGDPAPLRARGERMERRERTRPRVVPAEELPEYARRARHRGDRFEIVRDLPAEAPKPGARRVLTIELPQDAGG